MVDPFVDDYLAGRTPSPCVRCNTWIKFDLLLERARRARAPSGWRPATTRASSRGRTARSCTPRPTPEKDQSYYLFELTQEQLAALALPARRA